MCAGISETLLETFGVRLVSIDRPGYGQSDPHSSQTLYTAAQDIEDVIDELNLGHKVWLLGFSIGGMYCWAAARYIPQRLAGIALWSAITDWKRFTEDDYEAIMAGFTLEPYKSLYHLSKKSSFESFRLYVGKLCRRWCETWQLKDLQRGLSRPDCKALERPEVLELLLRDKVESVGGWNNGFGIAKDFQLLTSTWEFELEDVEREYKGPIHIWHGEEDTVVPMELQLVIKRELPEAVTLHRLRGEGHFSWYYFNDAGHRQTLSTLFQRLSRL